ncbi:GNAT family N-acetyltransferase [Gorillibacterium massiliense]|uniref:GNAT family N-acetyltransferase n=1 Tax=Gorillibacterium massiliense TaxID=1280390 RepID=UPI0004BB46ED|nr:GNAT family N-acetyltransferase [Gorillibacterium massiliense]
MELICETYTEWNEELWKKLSPIYREAFPHGAKPEAILRKMVERGIAYLHAGYVGQEPAVMAISGLSDTQKQPKLILDYIAVARENRSQGLGQQFVALIRDWALQNHDVSALIIEAEAEDTAENAERIRFWKRCGFIPTSYVHSYIWVPEPYRALYLPLAPDFRVTDDGKSLFRDITAFHERSFRKG